jgi:hypothetical protein
MEEKTQTEVNQGFFDRLNDGNTNDTNLKLELSSESLRKVLTKEIKFKDFNERLLNSKQEKVLVKEVLVESEIDYINSLKQLKAVFKEELKTAIEKVNDLYQSETLKLQKLYKSEVVGDRLLDIVKTISKSGWILLMKESGVYCYKFYSPPFEVVEGYNDKGVIKDYDEPVCSIRGIYVNILHPKITYGSILISSEGQHPNCDKKNFGSACVGTLENRDIPLDDSHKLLDLLNEVSNTYEVCHLDSAYYTPTINFKTRKDKQWKAA